MQESPAPDHPATERPTAGRPAPLHRLKLRWLYRGFWRRNAVFILGACLVGLVSAGFAWGADLAQKFFYDARAANPWLAIPLTVIGFIMAAAATARWFPTSRGSGIPQVIAARRSPTLERRAELIGGKVTLWKVALTLLGLAFGASIGREGPTVQVGACIMFMLGSYAGLRKPQGLVLAGAAAGIAAAFNTPLAGIMFAIEEMAKSYEKRISGLIIAAVVVAGAVSATLLGNYKYFGHAVITTGFSRAMVYAVICGIPCGLAGTFFSWALLGTGKIYRRLINQTSFSGKRFLPYLFPALCGLLVALSGLMTAGYANGTGYEQTKLALETGQAMPLWFGPLKLLATLASSASGMPGGLFSPSLSVGAGLGSFIATFVPSSDLSTIMLLSTAAYFAAVVQSPLTAFVIVTEMTVSNDLLVPLLATTFIAAGISNFLTREPLYHALSQQF
jgi:H+/Cl- antiporter ClcA